MSVRLSVCLNVRMSSLGRNAILAANQDRGLIFPFNKNDNIQKGEEIRNMELLKY